MSQDVTQITTHGALALARLATQYRGKPLISALLNCFAPQVQQIEDMLFGVLLGFRLDTPAVGEQLDVIGRVVGQDRESADDAEYKLRIAARIRANLSTGAAEDLYTVFGILLPGITLSIVPQYPASFIMDALEEIDGDLVPLYRQFFSDTKAAGVYAQFTYSLYDEAHSFTLAAAQGTVTSSSTLGLADDAQTSGGHLRGVFAG